MPDKAPVPPPGMVRCTVKKPFGAHTQGTIYMHPMDALEHHNLGIVEADKSFLDDLKALEAAKRKED